MLSEHSQWPEWIDDVWIATTESSKLRIVITTSCFIWIDLTPWLTGMVADLSPELTWLAVVDRNGHRLISWIDMTHCDWQEWSPTRHLNWRDSLWLTGMVADSSPDLTWLWLTGMVADSSPELTWLAVIDRNGRRFVTWIDVTRCDWQEWLPTRHLNWRDSLWLTGMVADSSPELTWLVVIDRNGRRLVTWIDVTRCDWQEWSPTRHLNWRDSLWLTGMVADSSPELTWLAVIDRNGRRLVTWIDVTRCDWQEWSPTRHLNWRDSLWLTGMVADSSPKECQQEVGVRERQHWKPQLTWRQRRLATASGTRHQVQRRRCRSAFHYASSPTMNLPKIGRFLVL